MTTFEIVRRKLTVTDGCANRHSVQTTILFFCVYDPNWSVNTANLSLEDHRLAHVLLERRVKLTHLESSRYKRNSLSARMTLPIRAGTGADWRQYQMERLWQLIQAGVGGGVGGAFIVSRPAMNWVVSGAGRGQSRADSTLAG